MATCSIITPSNYCTKKNFEKAKKRLLDLGFEKCSFYSLKRFFEKWAGSPKERLRQLHNAFTDTSDCIIACKGGSGVIHFVNDVSLSLVRRHKKPLMGYSDLTPLLNRLAAHANLVCFHGPVAQKKLDDKTINSVRTAFQMKNYSIRFQSSRNVRQKNLSGKIFGGNVSLLQRSLGTSFEVNMKNKIVFLEAASTISELKLYDRFVQLSLSKKFSPKALLFGYLSGVKNKKLFFQMIESLFPGVPLVIGLPFGHELPNIPIPLGVKTKIDFAKKTVTFHFPRSAKRYAVKF